MNDGNGSRMGILGAIRTRVRLGVESIAIREEIARNERLTLQTVNHRLAESAKAVIPDDDEFQNALIATADRELDETSADTLRENARRAAVKSTHMKGYLGSLERFVVGVGPEFRPVFDEEESDDVVRAVEAWWNQFVRVNRWGDLEDEIPRRAWRDGETFTRFFVQESDGPPEGWEPDGRLLDALNPTEPFDPASLEPESIPAGMTLLRLIPPEHITDPSNTVSHGILTAKNDVCTPLAYLWAPPDANGNPVLREVIPASEIQHIKLNVDQDVKRGRSQLEVLLKRNKQYEDWLGYRLVLNLVRAAVVLVKRIKGATATQLSAIRNKWASQRADSTSTNRAQMLKPGTTVHATEGMEYEMMSPNLQASDAQHDGRSLLLSEAAATGLPEYMFTGDSSNANFASTMVSESPAVREFERWQDFFGPYFEDIYRRVVVNGAEASQIPGLTPEKARTMGVELDWPELLSRNELDHTKANQIRHASGVLSEESWIREDGRDPAVEKARIEAERQERVEFTVPMSGAES